MKARLGSGFNELIMKIQLQKIEQSLEFNSWNYPKFAWQLHVLFAFHLKSSTHPSQNKEHMLMIQQP
jgi:hypothetical protein